MNTIPSVPRNTGYGSRKMAASILILLVAIALSAAWLAAQPSAAAAVAPLQAGPTSTPLPASAETAPRTSPLVAILVLLAPLIFIAWKSRGTKAPKITASCCLPVIDENQRPFAIPEDQPDSPTVTK